MDFSVISIFGLFSFDTSRYEMYRVHDEIKSIPFDRMKLIIRIDIWNSESFSSTKITI